MVLRVCMLKNNLPCLRVKMGESVSELIVVRDKVELYSLGFLMYMFRVVNMGMGESGDCQVSCMQRNLFCMVNQKRT